MGVGLEGLNESKRKNDIKKLFLAVVTATLFTRDPRTVIPNTNNDDDEQKKKT